MKKLFLTLILSVTFALPMLAPLAPHDLLHRLHNCFESHHVNDTGLAHSAHHHSEDVVHSSHHPIHFDMVTYFKDYLHVDLQKTQVIAFKSPRQQDQLPDLALDVLITDHKFTLASVKMREPPNYDDETFFDHHVYLTTQRIRI